ncbi:MAG: response regulator [Planctomycetota bacterium]
MQPILVIENDPVWRCSIRRHLNELRDVEVIEAASFREAILLIAVARPVLIIFDLDVSERFDVQALGNLQLPRLQVPMVFISAQAERLQDLIPKREGMSLFAKPISLRQLTKIVAEQLGARLGAPPSPFGVCDYLQLACLGRHSVVIEVLSGGLMRGKIVVRQGELWAANFLQQLRGEPAIYSLAVEESVQLKCKFLQSDPGPRNITAPWQAVLIESAMRRDKQASCP